ncbi:hypothetical protein V1L54_25175 [Streptomyces sp. TRM 70361]|uniref:hypothetical protein n=1 Tax=Streptomyces sp. TRM 70361 TaxID=3116553 RepID=UPI002E7B4E1F|nr:hypothetical protein [Streptomyces sp. TRM 70361]MEE1942658.1 hypothetical protein [Streptomyces sp. TRM 70361]
MTTDTHQRWTARARLAMAAQAVDRETADTAIDEVEQHCALSGEHPREEFGTPEEFARTVAVERVPERVRAGRDRAGMTPADYRRAGLAGVGLLLTVLGVMLWLEPGSTVTVTAPALAGTVLVAAVVLCVFAAVAASRVARWWWWGGAALAVLLAGTATDRLPADDLFGMPSFAVCLTGIILLLTWSLLPGGAPDHDSDTDHDPTQDHDSIHDQNGAS